MTEEKNATPVTGSSLIDQSVEQLPQGDTTFIGKCMALMLRYRTPNVLTLKHYLVKKRLT